MTRTLLYLFCSSIFVYEGNCKKYLIETNDGSHDDVASEVGVKDGIRPVTKWKRTIYGELRKYQTREGIDFETASAFCEGEGGRLPRITSQGEEEEVKNFMTERVLIWIGLHSRFRKGSWQFPNTTKSAGYFNFGEDGDPDGRCAAMTSRKEEKWLKLDCTSTTRIKEIICLKDAEVTEDSKGRVKMGKSACDDGEKGIKRDLKKLKKETTCSKHYRGDRKVFLKYGREKNKKFCEDVHPQYVPNHICINETIDYTGYGHIVTHGPHRPNWASFGEYSYCPPERYQHNIEHGSVVMLYHPCLNSKQLSAIKRTVSGCIRKHIITPSRIPTLETPVILIAWGCYQKFEFFDLNRVRGFIAKHGLKGPEGHFPKDGVYNFLQVAKATGEENKILC